MKAARTKDVRTYKCVESGKYLICEKVGARRAERKEKYFFKRDTKENPLVHTFYIWGRSE